MKKHTINTIATAVAVVSLTVSFIGFCGAIISTVSAFTTMACTGTAGMAIAQLFMEG